MTTCRVGLTVGGGGGGGGGGVPSSVWSLFRWLGARSYTHLRQVRAGKKKCHRYALGLPIASLLSAYLTVWRLTFFTETPPLRLELAPEQPDGANCAVPVDRTCTEYRQVVGPALRYAALI